MELEVKVEKEMMEKKGINVEMVVVEVAMGLEAEL